ncbi:phenylalanine--tRNA ligase subunit alpha [Candidatus Woesearchaeota archaeon]|jgi:phenylalanyl-tRNA synthetase alpha subunit|nr:phenylalanine--tRNA ligase subunit alpha [Candidatus Woesearchaeota archaeon]
MADSKTNEKTNSNSNPNTNPKFTNAQRNLLQVLSDAAGPISNLDLVEKYGLNNSDIVREGSFFRDQGWIEFSQQKYFEVRPLEGFESLRESDLPEYSLLKIMQDELFVTGDDLESRLGKKTFGMALNELRKLGLVSIERLDKELPLEITYVPGDNTSELILRNEFFQLLKSQSRFVLSELEDSDYVQSRLKEFEKRKLIRSKERSNYVLQIVPEGQARLDAVGEKEVAVLTPDMIRSGSWKTTKFKSYDPSLDSKTLQIGKHHPLRQLAKYVEKIFRDMGYEYMAGSLVSSSFYNFDALITAQDHPVREMQDTFFLEHPAKCGQLSPELVEEVRKSHTALYAYDFDPEVARKNVLRTHTTAVTAQYLEERSDTPMKLFSIGRVFRNETMDAMHLPEFHQIEGVVVGDVNLRDLMGHISVFYQRIGLTDIKFKKTFNPYTEPSMEIFAYHPALDKHVEVGNSGMFRPEMMSQFGFENQKAIAWGLALERLASIVFDVPKIKDLYGCEVDVDWLRGEGKLWL